MARVRYENGEPVPPNMDLRSAVEWKGVSYKTVINMRYLQPLCGFSRYEMGFAKKRTRYFPKEEVRLWLPVFAVQLPSYIQSLLDRDDLALVAHVRAVLEDTHRAGRLPDALLPFLSYERKPV